MKALTRQYSHAGQGVKRSRIAPRNAASTRQRYRSRAGAEVTLACQDNGAYPCVQIASAMQTSAVT